MEDNKDKEKEKNRDKDEVLEDASTSSDSFINDSEDNDEESQDFSHHEEPLTEQEIEELISDLVEVESKAAQAQESLEDESLAEVEAEVREELGQTLSGDELEEAVAGEMATFKEEWEDVLDKLETEISHLLEQLDGAGIELPKLYKWIESQVPLGCSTEAWKKRTHWIGSEVTSDATESVVDAEKYLQIHRPVRRRHGKVLEEGASGFLEKKLAINAVCGAASDNADVGWSHFSKICSNKSSLDAISFGSKEWSSVYLASTPQQAAELGIKFPGVDEVEEIDDVEGSSIDPFTADALANEGDLNLTEEQKRNFRKVKEEDDVNADKKLHIRLKRKRLKKRSKEVNGNSSMVSRALPNLTDSRDSKQSDSDGERDVDSEVLVTSAKSAVSKTVDQFNVQKIDEDMIHSNCPKNQNKSFRCTACDKVAWEVNLHPLLKVQVCLDCKKLVESIMKDVDCSECYCGWCGKNRDLKSCRSCKALFCVSCIRRNLGEKCLLEIQTSSWQCCCCNPSILQHLTSQLEELIESESQTDSSSETDSSSDSDLETSDAFLGTSMGNRRRQKKKIRRIIDDAELGEETRKKIAIEKERQERLKSLGAQFSVKSSTMNSGSCNYNKSEGGTAEVLGDPSRGYIVNVVRDAAEEPVRIPPSISAKLKPHQIAGIRFMWENIIQSVRKVKSGDKGLGCILAHTMGLGKTFQVIAFLYTAMRSVDLGLRTVLIVTPVSVLHNWRNEFSKWRPSELKPLHVFVLQDVPRERRANLIFKWRSKGGVLLIGYSAFRNFALGKRIKDRLLAKAISDALQGAPDILVCDEAHMIKNTMADVTQALKQNKCQRRIALTGSPLQNNLMEYYCMVDFVREGFLGSSHEFRNRFQNPIENGQHTNSTANDVKLMNLRSHILYEQLKGFVQRMDMNVVKKDLPPKTVFVLTVKLSPLQRKLYQRFLRVHGFTKDRVSGEIMKKRSFFAGYQALAQIWNHPGILQLMKENKDSSRREDAENFLVDECSSDENMDYNVISGEKLGNSFESRKNVNGFLQEDWWRDLLQDNYKDIDYSGKMVLLLDVLKMCSGMGDKALVFSQNIATLDLIEFYLSKLPRKGKTGKCWRRGKDWYRLDGRTEGSLRQKIVENFNDSSNLRVKCTLLSTKAGSLGINLHAANRVIIVDGSWNPTYDLQAIYRVWRYGQTKPVFAYRLLAHGTMEEKIYKRQVTKEGLAARVVDKQQVHRTISKEEMLDLFYFGDEEDPDMLPKLGQEQTDASEVTKSCSQEVPCPQGGLSSDKLMQKLIERHHPRWIANYHEHETLLQENEDEKLSKEEQDLAWEVYRKDIEWKEVKRVSHDESVSFEQQQIGNKAVNEQEHVTSEPYLGQKTKISKIEITDPDRKRVSSYLERARYRMAQRKCTNLSHLLTLRSQGTKMGCTTVCGECAQEIRWEDLKRE